ncbi:response regulator transcription factor [Streptomyces griseoincarnatus]|uniref:Response regulator transcription factor n=1 Tax=Streptomyces griseoincarnatus TaxID=29305 RepID=A0ABT0VK93_STRGI|nr:MULTISPECIES: response regulator transcription factor [Streptomyces]MBJ6624606.1 response regulator transcription factor [Streptomyces sp. I4(2020)]MCM2511783.1 response regulator transcription factor [Streptomyces griseoincarnatus]WPW21864.1 response regulator transcription factor [Streptomyces griseoincarnatus]
MSAYVLVAEDDEKQAELIRRYLVHAGYAVTVVHDGPTALDMAAHRPPDLLVLDWMLPGLDGLEICRRIRATGDMPLLMLTARSTEDDLLLGLDMGADDYMTKPFRPRELVARIRTLLRRTRQRERAEDVLLEAGPLTVAPDRHEVSVNGRPVNCTPSEFRLLSTLVAAPERVFTRAQLLHCIADHGRAVTERTVDMHMVNLRKKIEISPRRPELLLTVHGVGYKLSRGRRDV